VAQKKVTLIVSDLHVGGGPYDKGDDHVYDRDQFRNFVLECAGTPEGRAGDVELVVNGDFLEFAQTSPAVYEPRSSEHWCSEAESRRKLDDIIKGHPDIFEALKTFQGRGNQVTIAAGNHDVDLYWPDVQRRLREVSGDALAFDLGATWYARYGGRLLVGHGHMFDPANKFAHWGDPVLRDVDPPRLEMCAGTLFMVKFVNRLEKDYPFSDNLRPVTALASVLMKEDRLGFLSVGWLLTKFLARHPRVSASVQELNKNLGRILVEKIRYDDKFAARVTELYRRAISATAEIEDVRRALAGEQAVFDFLIEVMARLDPLDWENAFGRLARGTMAIGGGGRTLTIREANGVNKDFLWDMAQNELLKEDGPQVVVMGHTHQPDERRAAGGGLYFNPGSWTRYVDYESNPDLTLEDLRDEARFPYELNCVRIEELQDGKLDARMIRYDRQEGITRPAAPAPR
jgi:UDP-2,3-diacylglucosamine pyrophosphatase LpxH